MTHKPVYEVAAAVIRRDGRILLTRRPPGGHQAGLWEFPGGKQEVGESLPETLVRELAEELLIETAVDELLATETHEYADRVIHLHFFSCRLLTGMPITVGCDALAWVTPESLGQYAMPPADARFVDSGRGKPLGH